MLTNKLRGAYKRLLLQPLRLLCSCDVPLKYWFSSVVFPHPVGIVINPGTRFGRNVWVFQNVTIGNTPKLKREYGRVGCVIEDNVIIYAGAVIIGSVKIGRDSFIGGNAVITEDIPEGTKQYNEHRRVNDD